MFDKEILDQLLKALKVFEKTLSNLIYTFNNVKDLEISENLSLSQKERLDSLASRHLRHYEIYVNSILKTTLFLLGKDPKHLIDLLNSSLKQNLIQNPHLISTARVHRNIIAHEYLDEEWVRMYEKLIESLPEFIDESTFTIQKIKMLIKEITE